MAVRHSRGWVTDEQANKPCPPNGILNKTRENWFVASYVQRTLTAMGDLLELEGAALKTALLVIAMSAVLDAGYRKVARSTLSQKKQATYLMSLPRIQQAIDIKYSENGLSLDNCAAILSDIAHGRIEDVTVNDRLRAIDMRFKTTTGYATQKTATATAQVPVDAFFDPETFNTAPPINVTPGDDEEED